jgi:enoyl-CoA hydratase
MSDVQYESQNGVAVVTLNRAPVNALSTTFLEQLDKTLEALEEDPQIRALVLTGAGKAFSAGLDLKEVPGYTVEEQRSLIRTLGRALGRLYGFPRPTVAAVNGHAIAGGLILALATDRRLAASDPDREPQLGLTEVQVGIPFPAAPLAVVQAELSPQAARTLVLGAGLHSATEALNLGVVDEIHPAADLLPRALETARRLAELPAATYARVKGQLRRAALDRIEKAETEDPLLEDWLE